MAAAATPPSLKGVYEGTTYTWDTPLVDTEERIGPSELLALQLKIVRVNQVGCSPPGALKAKGIVAISNLDTVIKLRQLSKPESQSVLFQMDLLRQKVLPTDPRLLMTTRIQELCQGASLSQMHFLRLLMIKAWHLLSKLMAKSEFKGVMVVEVDPKDEKSILCQLRLKDVYKRLTLFNYFFESSLRLPEKAEASEEGAATLESSEELTEYEKQFLRPWHFKIAKRYFESLFTKLPFLRKVFPSAEMEELLRIFTCIHECLEEPQKFAAVLLQPSGSLLFQKGLIASEMSCWVEYILKAFVTSLRVHQEMLEEALREENVLKEHGKSFDIQKGDREWILETYVLKMEDLKRVAEALIVKRLEVAEAMKRVEAYPEESARIATLEESLAAFIKKTAELTKAFDQFDLATSKKALSLSAKLEKFFNHYPSKDPCSPLASFVEHHNACVWYPYQFVNISFGVLIKALSYWKSVREVREKFLPLTEGGMRSQFIKGYHLFLADLLLLVKRGHESASEQSQKQQLYTLFSHIVSLEEIFYLIDLQRGFIDFESNKMALLLMNMCQGFESEIQTFLQEYPEGGAKKVLHKALAKCAQLKGALLVQKMEGASLSGLYHLFAPLGTESEPTSEVLNFFRKSLEMSAWSLDQWDLRPKLRVGDHPFLQHLCRTERAHVRGYITKLEKSAWQLRSSLKELCGKFRTANLSSKEGILEVADSIQRAEENTSLLGVSELLEKVLEECREAVDRIEDLNARKAASEALSLFALQMSVFRDEDVTFFMDVRHPNAPLLAYARLLSLFESKKPHRKGASEAQSERKSPIKDLYASVEPSAAASALEPLVVGPEVASTQRLPFKEAKASLEHFVHQMKQVQHKEESLVLIEEYLHLLQELEESPQSTRLAPYATFDQIAYLCSMITEQLLKFLLCQRGLTVETAPLLSGHNCLALYSALESKFKELQGLSERRLQAIFDIGRHAQRGYRELWYVETPTAAILRFLAAFSSPLRKGEKDLALASQEIERGMKGIEDGFFSLFEVMKGCGFPVQGGAAAPSALPKERERERPLQEVYLTERGIDLGAASSAPLNRQISSVVREVRKKGSGGLCATKSEEVAHQWLAKRYQVLVRSLSSAQNHYTALEELFPHSKELPIPAHSFSLMVLTKGCLLVESLLKAALAQSDIPEPDGKGHILWHQEGAHQRLPLIDHHLHGLYTLLKGHLKSPLAAKEEQMLLDLNYFINKSRYLVQPGNAVHFVESYKGVLTGEERVKQSMHMLSVLSRSQEGFHTPFSKEVSSHLFTSKQQEEWPALNAQEQVRIVKEVTLPYVRALMSIAERLLLELRRL